MGSSCSTISSESKQYKKNPRLFKEFKSGNLLLKNLHRIEFQFYSDFAEVWKVQNKSDYTIYSLQARKKTELLKQRGYQNYVTRENRIISELSNSFILKVNFAFQDKKTLYMATEYISSRLSYYIKEKSVFTNYELQYLAASIILGLEYLASKNILHRGLRPENILFTPEGRVKIGGFLFAREHNPSISNSLDCIGYPGYMAPELLEKKHHCRAVDLYLLGIILYEVVTSKRLFTSEKSMETLTKMATLNIQKQDILSSYPEDLVNFINSLLKYQPKKRLGAGSFDEVKSHSWFKGFNWEALANGKLKAPFIPEKDEREPLNKGSLINTKCKMSKNASKQGLFVGFQHGIESKTTISSKAFDEELI